MLIKHLRRCVQAHRKKKGFEIRIYTKEELAEIDAKLMEKFRDMVEGDNDVEQVPFVIENSPGLESASIELFIEED